MKVFLLLAFISSFYFSAAQSFKVVPLGIKGGGDESNLSSYLLSAGDDRYVCLDAGTVSAGIEKAIAAGSLHGDATTVLRKQIKGYLISHGHLDHLSGMILNSPDDTSKNIYVMPYVRDVLRNKYFTNEAWINFGDEGDQPALKKYHYALLDSAKEFPLTNTDLFVTAFPLSHGNPYKSTAFLIRNGENYLLYLGDTGADEIEHTNHLHNLWMYIAQLISTKKLKAIFIETSFPDEQPKNKLFGHLTPELLMNEMKNLSALAEKENMKSFLVVITHIKPAGNHEADIKRQLKARNSLKLHLIFAKQAEILIF